jgi:hypothetical protein
VRTSNVPLAPPAGAVVDPAESAKLHPCPWLTVNTCPAIVSVPVRAGPVVGATSNVTALFPLPPAPDGTLIHGTLLRAAQGHPAAAVTATVSLPPAGGTDAVVGVIENEQPCDWATVIICPATVSVPERDGPVVDAIASATDPGPVPVPPAVTLIHTSFVVAVHGHPPPVVTVRVRAPPEGSTVTLSGATSYVHPADSVTEKGSPAMVSVAVRGGPVVGATLNATDAEPFPLAAEVTAIQSALDVAVHGHSPLDACMSTLPFPPGCGNDADGCAN